MHLPALAVVFLMTAVLVNPQEAAEETRIPLHEGLRLARSGQGGRAPLFTDAVEWSIARGEWTAPVAGDRVELPDGGTAVWEPIEVSDKGSFDPGGSYTWCTVSVADGGVWLLEARGHRQVRVNGAPRGGDVYNTGWMRLPVRLVAGDNEFLFRSGRGRLGASLAPPPAPVFFEGRDNVLPDVIRGESEPLWASVLVTNATADWRRGLEVRADLGGVSVTTRLPDLPPVSQRKVAVQVPTCESEEDRVAGTLTLLAADPAPLHTRALSLRVRASDQHHRRTFVSEIDGSVQYYGVAPRATEAEAPENGPALVLSLHGAGVQGMGQANCYRPKDWAVVAAPTNRRPFGFDWEDWGRLDALEVLELARTRFAVDPRRLYLTGHSMGGHGVWNLGAHRPDLFAAIAPSAGWRDFWSYGGAGDYESDGSAARLLDRAVSASRTLLLKENYRHGGVYILHGDADDNVPVSQARHMREQLAAFHPNWAYYERPGAGHWWGNQCVDWPPLMEFLKQNVQPEPASVHRVQFTTVNPGILSRCDWVTIESQQHSMEPSRIDAAWDPSEAAATVTTRNVRRLALDLSHFTAAEDAREEGAADGEEAGLKVSVDGEALELPWPDGPLRLHRPGDSWVVIDQVPSSWKSPHRAGPFKDAFRHRMQFVVATGGSDEHNRWARNKARFDAETFQFRGNGAVDIVRDTDFDPTAEPDRGVILYGNADSNQAWGALFNESPIQVFEGLLTVGDEALEGDDLVCLFLAPRPGSVNASVAAVSATGPAGRHAADLLPYFVSGVAYPDWIVLGADFLWRGAAAVRGAGFLDETWSPSETDSAWSDGD